MVKTLSLFLLISILFCSCKENKRGDIVLDMPYYQITNEHLLCEVEKYIDYVGNDKTVYINAMNIEDTIVYTLSYGFSATGFLGPPSTIYIDVYGETVALSYFGFDEIGLPDNVSWKYLKNLFPEDYTYYLENNDYPIPPTGRTPEWKLTFKYGKLIRKQIIDYGK